MKVVSLSKYRPVNRAPIFFFVVTPGSSSWSHAPRNVSGSKYIYKYLSHIASLYSECMCECVGDCVYVCMYATVYMYVCVTMSVYICVTVCVYSLHTGTQMLVCECT